MTQPLTWFANVTNKLGKRLAGDSRLARIFHGSISGIFGRGLTFLIGLITLPLTVHYLGKLEYGIWVTISTSVAMLSVADLGIANTLTNLISEAFAADDRAAAQRAFATAFWMALLLCGILAFPCWILWQHMNWAAIFKLSDLRLLAQTKACIAITAAFFLISLPLNLANRVLAGYQQVHFSNYFAMAGNALTLPLLISVIAAKGTIVTLTAAYCGLSIISCIGLNLWLWFRYTPWMKPSLGKVRRSTGSQLLREGMLFFVVQLTTLVVFYSDNLVITRYLGPAEVTPYSIAYRLISWASLLQALIAPSIWPALSEAYGKGDLAWVERTFRAINRKSLTAIGCLAVVLAAAGRPIIRAWAGQAAVPSARLLWLMAAFAFTMSMTSNQALLLNASRRLCLEAIVAVLAAVANLGFSIYLVQRIGSEGVVLGSLLSFLFFMVVPQAWEVRRVLAGKYLSQGQAPSEAQELALRKF